MMASVPGLGWPEYPDRGYSRLTRPPGGEAGPRRDPGPASGAAATADRQPEQAGTGAAGLVRMPGGLGWPGEPRAAVPPRAADHGAAGDGAAGDGGAAADGVTDQGATDYGAGWAARPDLPAGREAEDYPGRLETAAQVRGGPPGQPGAVSRGTGSDSGGRHPGWPDDETGQESETAMAEGRAWTSADQEAAARRAGD